MRDQIVHIFEGLSGGEGGIRTPGGVAPTPHFECGAFDHSATSPRGRRPLKSAWSTRAGLWHSKSRAATAVFEQVEIGVNRWPQAPCLSMARCAIPDFLAAVLGHDASLAGPVAASAPGFRAVYYPDRFIRRC